MTDFIVYVSMAAMLVGGVLFFMAANFGDKAKTFRMASIFLFLGGIIGGCFATPSRGMPNGTPGAFPASMVLIAVGIFLIAGTFAKKPSAEAAAEQKKSKKMLLVIAGVVFLLLLVASFSSSPSHSSSEPWRDLGVTRQEYMDVYNYYKYGK